MTRMPGFTAEASISEISRNYVSAEMAARAPMVEAAFVNFSCCRACIRAGGDCYPTPHGCYCF